MNIFLIGYRGVGKTVHGKALAKELDYKIKETDDMVTEKAGMNIPDIVEKYGWKTFRDYETEVLNEVCYLNNCVVSTGGGLPIKKENRDIMKNNNNKIILLEADEKDIYRRINGDKNRPALTDNNDKMMEIRQNLRERTPIYRSIADFTINTSGDPPIQNITNKIIKYLEQKEVNNQ